ncbi:class I SAM-dependent methyltransferase [Candidatus Gracilibacteria bacterium]|nr:class I SAM-dependent methyltransferase [Candidatus Gracilibacteria bacterium]
MQSKLGRNLRVLDLGCGNGRFLHWLVKNFAEVEYVGVDFSDYLLGVAKKNDQKRIGTFIKSDLFMDEWIFLNSLVDFDLIVSFGLVHHIPSKELVETFFGNLNKLIRNQKTLGIFTIWNYHKLARLEKKILRQEDLPKKFQVNLGKNENILIWDKEEYSTRFSRCFSKEEILGYLGHGFQVLDFYMDDDRNQRRNSYFVISR